MILKYTYIGDNIILNLPDNEYWELRFRFLDDDNRDDYNLYVICREKQIEIRNTDYWTSGRPKLPYEAVGALYEEIVDVVATQLAANPNLRLIDIDSVEMELIDKKYEKLWLDKNYLEISNDGSW